MNQKILIAVNPTYVPPIWKNAKWRDEMTGFDRLSQQAKFRRLGKTPNRRFCSANLSTKTGARFTQQDYAKHNLTNRKKTHEPL